MSSRIIYFILLNILLSQQAFSQNPANIPSLKIVQLKKATNWAGVKNIRIDCPFAEPQFNNNTELQLLKNGQIVMIELYYTQFKRNESFNQLELNKKRYENLNKILPNILENNLIKFKNIEQTGAIDVVSAETYFHGFIIYYLPENTHAAREEEISELKDYLGLAEGKPRIKNLDKFDTSPLGFYDKAPKFGNDECDIVTYIREHLKYPKEAVSKNIRGTVLVTFVVNRAGGIQNITFKSNVGSGCEDAVKEVLEYMPKWTAAKNKELAVNAHVELKIHFGYEVAHIDRNKCASISITDKSMIKHSWIINKDQRIISQTLGRLKQNESTALIMDVTASMGPYIADMLEYIKGNLKSIEHFYFFNDGDNSEDYKKEIGKTGGVYSVKNSNFDEILMHVFATMEKGVGGDIPENDIEAIVKAQNENPQIQKIILAADNFAFPRDIELMSEVKKPLLIILCGSQGRINPLWLTFAKKHKAQLAVQGAFLPSFPALNEGDVFKIRAESYVWKNNTFQPQ